MKNNRLLLSILFTTLVLSACSNRTLVSTQNLIPTVNQNSISPAPQLKNTEISSYPAPQLNNTEISSYPAPESNLNENTPYPYPITTSISTPNVTFTQDPSMGYVLGKLLNKNTPIPNISLYLAEVITDSTGKQQVAGLDPRNSPNTITDEQGNFVFTQLKPGSYALILDIVTNQFLLNYPNTEKPIILQVEAGKENNLGDLNFNDLTLP
jgi:hypothetical protein